MPDPIIKIPIREKLGPSKQDQNILVSLNGIANDITELERLAEESNQFMIQARVRSTKANLAILAFQIGMKLGEIELIKRNLHPDYRETYNKKNKYNQSKNN